MPARVVLNADARESRMKTRDTPRGNGAEEIEGNVRFWVDSLSLEDVRTARDRAVERLAGQEGAALELALTLAPRSCDPGRLREREHLQFVPLAELPEGHGLGDVFDEFTGGGIPPGSLVGVGAPGTGAGKTALLFQALDGLAMRSAATAEDPEATVPLTPVVILSEMAEEDLESRTLGRLLGAPGQIFLAGRSARRFHKWAWVERMFNEAEALMRPGGLFAKMVAWQRYERAGKLSGPTLLQLVESKVDCWLTDLERAYPGREIVPVVALDPINSFLSQDGRSEVETLGEMAAALDELADRRRPDRQRWIVAFTIETNKSAAIAAGNGTPNPSAAAVYRGTMQLLHRCDLALILTPEAPDPDGVRPVTLTLDKNRTGRSGVSTVYRWQTRTGLRFVPETIQEHASRGADRGTKSSAPTTKQVTALCELVERISAAQENATETRLRTQHRDIGCTYHAVVGLILHCKEKGLVRALDRKVRGGGTPLTVIEGWRGKLQTGMPE